jgi:hypothetical protein
VAVRDIGNAALVSAAGNNGGMLAGLGAAAASSSLSSASASASASSSSSTRLLHLFPASYAARLRVHVQAQRDRCASARQRGAQAALLFEYHAAQAEAAAQRTAEERTALERRVQVCLLCAVLCCAVCFACVCVCVCVRDRMFSGSVQRKTVSPRRNYHHLFCTNHGLNSRNRILQSHSHSPSGYLTPLSKHHRSSRRASPNSRANFRAACAFRSAQAASSSTAAASLAHSRRRHRLHPSTRTEPRRPCLSL